MASDQTGGAASSGATGQNATGQNARQNGIAGCWMRKAARSAERPDSYNRQAVSWTSSSALSRFPRF